MRPYPFRWLTAAALLTALVVPAAAEVRPLNGEFRVNGTTDFKQRNPVAAFAPSGAALVVWENDQTGIRGRFHRLDGTPLGDQLTLVANDGLNGRRAAEVLYRKDPAVAFLPGGHFLLAWTEELAFLRSAPFIEHRRTLDQDVYVQRFDAAGAPAGPRYRVNDTRAASQVAPKLALLGSGQAVVVWKSAAGTGAGVGTIVARLVGPGGRPLGAEIEASADAASDHAAVVAGRDGFLLAWDTALGNGQIDVFARLYEASGQPRGPAFLVTSGTIGWQRWPAVAAGADGHYLIAWQSVINDRSIVHIHGQFVSPAGGFLGGQLLISRDTGTQLAPAIAASRTGYLATWLEWKGLAWGIHAVELDALGARLGEEVSVATSRVTKNYRRAIAADGRGGFVIPWETVARKRPVIAARGLAQ
ncbi:MAG TPA: hypothetical protein VF121_15115 [Thermoanaerobaculia bacterium]|nr:hypothetical protein [Thermoanaerobaculia bacterium]